MATPLKICRGAPAHLTACSNSVRTRRLSLQISLHLICCQNRKLLEVIHPWLYHALYIDMSCTPEMVYTTSECHPCTDDLGCVWTHVMHICQCDHWMTLHFYSQGSASTFQPYLQILPEHHDCLLAWTPAEADELKGDPHHTMHSLPQIHTKLLLSSYQHTARCQIMEVPPKLRT